MLEQTLQLAESRSISNIETAYAEAESLPFEDSSFDLVACRLARHHFYDAQKSLHEMNRVLKPSGKLAFTDNVTVDDSAAAEVYNRYEQIRDPSHKHVGSLNELKRDFETAGFSILHWRTLTKEFEFHRWADRQNVSDTDKAVLLDIMKSIPSELTPLFAPRWADQTMYFCLWEAAIVATKAAS